MSDKIAPRPTDRELAILNVLWQHGPATVRQVHELLPGAGATQYTTTLKQLQVMTERRLVDRDDSQKSHVFSAAIEEGGAKRTLVAGVIDQVFGGSVRKMVLHALEARDITDEEVDEIKRLLVKRGTQK
ncbi:MAG: BlaI family penicillinase repressor [Pirellulaceae bacterium]|jgi:BlaI family penicillinase repressor